MDYESMLASGAQARLHKARVAVVAAQHSWAALPGPLASRLLDSGAPLPLALRLHVTPPGAAALAHSSVRASGRGGGPPRYLAWGGAVSSALGAVELSAGLASALHLPAGAEVSLEPLPRLAAASSVVVEPLGPADWEVVELNAGLLEDILLGQAGVACVGQPFVLWARQAKVALRVTSVQHAPGQAEGGPGGALVLRGVATLTAGTELHIAPKPRAAPNGSALGPATLPSAQHGGQPGAAGAAPERAGRQQHHQQHQQQQQQPEPVWLRVEDAGARHLLDTGTLQQGAAAAAEGPKGQALLAGRGRAADDDNDLALPPPGGAAEAGGPAAPQSWATTSLFVNAATAGDAGLEPGQLVRAFCGGGAEGGGGGGAAGSASVLPLQSLVLAVQVDADVPWGHVGVSPPLQQCLALSRHEYLQLVPLQCVTRLAQLPSFSLHPLMASGGAPPQAAEGRAPGSPAGAGAPAAASGASDGDAAGARQAAQHAAAAAGLGEIEPLPEPAAAEQQQQQQQHRRQNQQQQQQQADSFTGLGLLQGIVSSWASRPLQALGLPHGQGPTPSPHAVHPTPDQQQRPQRPDAPRQQQQEQEQRQPAPQQEALRSSAVSPGGASSRRSSGGGLLEAVGGTAIHAWLAMQALAAAAAAKAAGQWAAGVLPCCGPMLVHFRLGDGLGGEADVDHLLLLVPHLAGRNLSSATGSCCALPSGVVLQVGGGAAPQRPIDVHVAGALVCEPSALAAVPSRAAVRHSTHVALVSGPAACPQEQQQLQQQRRQQEQQEQQLGQPGRPLQPGDFPWLQPALQAALDRLAPRLSLPSWQAWQEARLPLPGGALLVGASDGGRAWLLQLIGQAAAERQGAHVLKVSCKGLAGQPFDAAAGVLADAAGEALACCPGLLLLDDLDLLVPAPGGDGPAGAEQDSAAATRLAEWLADLMRWAARQPRPLAFAATCSAAAALPAVLRAAGCLDCELKVPPLGAPGRAALLVAGLRARGVPYGGAAGEVEAVAAERLEGFDSRDVQLVADRAAHAALARSVAAAGAAGPLSTSADDVRAALAGFVPAAFWRAGQQRGAAQAAAGGPQGWDDVGGLTDALAALHEALVIPAKHGALLAAAPLRLRTGLLLFGPPGCGKTHVVAAAVAATGARLIAVKGPELLNKYIGQSEAAVRELFARAAAAAPAVLFFDEFDAIAPPRGHDSTGVTDRVVNQLLTELDGVEGLSGVAVLAATSRPDLIDAALLRPGRLDRMVFCGFPGEAERLAILRAAGRRLELAADVELEEVAAATPHFTGADLSAVLSEAQLLAVHERLELRQQQQQQEEEEGEVEGGGGAAAAAGGGGGAPPLRMEHLRRALARARPSLPPAEQRRLAAVYSRFQAGRDPGISNRQLLDEDRARVKHATLA